MYNLEFYNLEFYNSEFYDSKFYNLNYYNLKFYNLKCYNLKCYNIEFYNLKCFNLEFYNLNSFNSESPRAGSKPKGKNYFICLNDSHWQSRQTHARIMLGSWVRIPKLKFNRIVCLTPSSGVGKLKGHFIMPPDSNPKGKIYFNCLIDSYWRSRQTHARIMLGSWVRIPKLYFNKIVCLTPSSGVGKLRGDFV